MLLPASVFWGIFLMSMTLNEPQFSQVDAMRNDYDYEYEFYDYSLSNPQ